LGPPPSWENDITRPPADDIAALEAGSAGCHCSSIMALLRHRRREGTTRTENGVLPTQGAFHETLERTQGGTFWFETGFYPSTSIQPNGGGSDGRPPSPGSTRASLSLEVGYQPPQLTAYFQQATPATPQRRPELDGHPIVLQRGQYLVELNSCVSVADCHRRRWFATLSTGIGVDMPDGGRRLATRSLTPRCARSDGRSAHPVGGPMDAAQFPPASATDAPAPTGAAHVADPAPSEPRLYGSFASSIAMPHRSVIPA
jgi:hypothetical protein